MLEHASDIRGILVVSAKEGAQLGTVSEVHIDPQTKHVVAFSYRTRRIGGDRYYVPVEDVDRVGRDVLLIASEEAVVHQTNGEHAPGRSLEDLQGMRVTTMDGKHLGELADIDISYADWSIGALVLSDARRLPVEVADIRVGDDVLVPADSAGRLVEPAEKSGFFRRTLGKETVESTGRAVKRALARPATESQRKQPEGQKTAREPTSQQPPESESGAAGKSEAGKEGTDREGQPRL